MALVELIATPATKPEVLDQLEAFVTTSLGKSVVRAKDTPNFIANRVGIAGMLATIKEAEKFGLTYDVVDDLTGKKFGRASSGTFRTADVVGLDTMAHVVKTLQDNLKDDPFFAQLRDAGGVHEAYRAGRARPEEPAPASTRRSARTSCASTWRRGDYVPAGGKADEIVARMLKKPAAERLKLLRESSNPQAQFLWAILRDSFHYAAVHLADIADSARDIDFAMRWGFGTQQGPFELWQEAGWKQVAEWVEGRHRCRQGAQQGAAARVGVRRPVAANGRAHAGRLVERCAEQIRCAQQAARLRTPALPGERGRVGRRAAVEGRHRALQERRGARVDARRRGRHREHHREAAPDQPDA